MLVRKHVWVSGRVQGVWFRQTCAERAGRLHVAGWVRNCPDGRVEAVFEGDSTAVADMAAWCQHGPEGALVTDVVVTEEPPRGLTDFRVGSAG
jgi:acylphosphatase